MPQITQQQKAEIRSLTRIANRRIERATEGQRNYLESVVRKMTGTGASKWSSAYKGLTERQAAAKIRKLRQFLYEEDETGATINKRSTTRSGWEAMKESVLSKTGDTWRNKKGYDITDEELAIILEQEDVKSTQDFYRAVNLVQAQKFKRGQINKSWKGTEEQIAAAINLKYGYKEALKRGLKAKEGWQEVAGINVQRADDTAF